MTPSEWQEVERIYLEASELPPGAARNAFLDRVCVDGGLRAEVESLLQADEHRGRFLDLPPSRLAADLLDRRPGALTPGEQEGNYRVRSLLSMGGMGEVYLADDVRTGMAVVLKVLRRHLTADSFAVERFEREALAAGALQHPNIINVHEFGTFDAGLYIAMEWIDGQTWRALIDEHRGAVPFALALDCARQASDALAAAHDAGIVHRDIKPDNLMLGRNGVVTVLDFGLARLSTASVLSPDPEASGGSGTISGTLSGTLPYMSPELLMGEPATPLSDVFSFGSVLYELFTGRHPFAGETPLDIFEAIECRTPDAPGVRDGLDRLLLAMLDRVPGNRPTARAVASELQALELEQL